MSERSYTHMDKTAWGDGPWQDEPDKLQWIDPNTGLDCLIVRNHHGSLCGYVGVPPGHPHHGAADYDTLDVEVHGGLTFADRCMEGAPEESGICHVPAPGRPADVWWFGFDCGHAFDTSPAMVARMRAAGIQTGQFGDEHSDVLPPTTYKPIGYVREEVTGLAKQLANA